MVPKLSEKEEENYGVDDDDLLVKLCPKQDKNRLKENNPAMVSMILVEKLQQNWRRGGAVLSI